MAELVHLPSEQCLVHDPGYKTADESASRCWSLDTMGAVQETFVYQTAANRLYPVIGPIADPAFDKLTHSPVYAAVKDHFKPHTAADQPLPAICAQC